MKLKPQAQQEYEELKKVMSYVNSYPDIDGKYKEDQKQDIFPASKNQRIWQKISDNWVIINPIDLPINKEQAKQGGANEI